MTRFLLALTLAFALAACQTVTPPPPTPEPEPTPTPTPATYVLFVDGYVTPQFVNYPTMMLRNVVNSAPVPFQNRVISVRCTELGVDTWFRTAPFTLLPNQVADVPAPYSSGYPMMVDAGAVCYASVPSVTGQPEWRVRQAP